MGTLGVDEPILRYVDLSTVHIAEARELTLPAWARTVIPGPKGAPLLYAGSRGGLPTAVLAFEPRQSDLPLQVAFPILVANLTGELLGGSAAPIAAVRPGDPVSLTVPTGAAGLRVARPDGSSLDLMPGAAGGSTVTYTLTDRLGVYTATPIVAPTASASASGLASPSGPASAGASALPAAVEPGTPIRFAVDLFDVNESTIAPGRESDLVNLGSTGTAPSPDPSGSPSVSAAPSGSLGPAASAAPGSAAADRPNARDQLWVPIVLIALVVLSIEWCLYHRDALLRGWRAATARLRRPERNAS
jgi:hypothetical protein